MNRSILTVAGLMLAFGTPAFAQGTATTVGNAANTVRNGAASVGNAAVDAGHAAVGAGTQAVAAATHNGGNLRTALTNAGVKNINQVNGTAMTAQTSDGFPVIVVVGPKNLTSSGSVNVNRNDVTKMLQKAGLKNVSTASGARMVRGVVDDHDNDKEAVLAISGVNLATNGDASGSLDTSQFDKSLRNAGVKSSNAFKGELAKATTANGSTVYMIVGAKDLKARQNEKAGHFDDQAVRQSFDKGGLSNLTVLDNVHLMEGTMNNHTVFAVTGKGLQG